MKTNLENKIIDNASDKNDNDSKKKNVFILNKVKKVKNWTKEEDDGLFKYAEQFEFKNWNAISKHLPERSAIQCSARYKRIKPGLVKGAWKEREDEMLLDMIRRFGKNWSLISKYMSSRSGKQIRDRFLNTLDPHIMRDKFTKQEDDKILECYANMGSQWSKIAHLLPRRTGDMIKNRFYSSLRTRIHTDDYRESLRKKKLSAMYRENTLMTSQCEGEDKEDNDKKEIYEFLNKKSKKPKYDTYQDLLLLNQESSQDSKKENTNTPPTLKHEDYENNKKNENDSNGNTKKISLINSNGNYKIRRKRDNKRKRQKLNKINSQINELTSNKIRLKIDTLNIEENNQNENKRDRIQNNFLDKAKTLTTIYNTPVVIPKFIFRTVKSIDNSFSIHGPAVIECKQNNFSINNNNNNKNNNSISNSYNNFYSDKNTNATSNNIYTSLNNSNILNDLNNSYSLSGLQPSNKNITNLNNRSTQNNINDLNSLLNFNNMLVSQAPKNEMQNLTLQNNNMPPNYDNLYHNQNANTFMAGLNNFNGNYNMGSFNNFGQINNMNNYNNNVNNNNLGNMKNLNQILQQSILNNLVMLKQEQSLLNSNMLDYQITQLINDLLHGNYQRNGTTQNELESQMSILRQLLDYTIMKREHCRNIETNILQCNSLSDIIPNEAVSESTNSYKLNSERIKSETKEEEE